MKKCETKHCRRKCKSGICSTCKVRKWRAEHPIEYAYSNTKNNAKRRNKLFNISLEDFREFCVETNYLLGKGRTKASYSIDCIINALGYTKGNLQRLTVSENSKKGVKLLVYNWQTKEASFYKFPTTTDQENYF